MRDAATEKDFVRQRRGSRLGFGPPSIVDAHLFTFYCAACNTDSLSFNSLSFFASVFKK
jgi:hypothetical protein